MKRFLCTLFVILFSMPVFGAEISALSREEVKVFVSGSQVEFLVEPIITDGRILAPIREISESLGAVVSWDDATKTAGISTEGLTVFFRVGQKTMLLNGTESELDVAASIIGGRTFVPVRALAEALGLDVEWKDEIKTAFLSLKRPLGKDYIIPVTYYVKSDAYEGCVLACKTMVLSNYFDKEYTFEEMLEINGGDVYTRWGEEYCEGVSWKVIMPNELELKEETGIWEESEYTTGEKLKLIADNIEDSSGIIAQFAKDGKHHGVVITGYTAEGELVVCDPDTKSEDPKNTLIADSCLADMFELYTTDELLPYLTCMRVIAK